jgi:hypothetical protein
MARCRGATQEGRRRVCRTFSAVGADADIRTIIDRLVEERQTLRRAQADRTTLDANRAAIAYWHVALMRAAAEEALRPKQNV